MNGILIMDKPSGFTSHDVVAKMRGILKMKKIGHAGTLDPMATGVLPLFLGRSTKAASRLPNQDKAYLATIQLGITTDTLDITGTILERRPVTASPEEVQFVLEKFVGTIEQVPPMYSAVQIQGKRLYELARQGKTIERPSREVTIYSIDMREYKEETQEYSFLVSCSKGTYIRTLAEDVGEALGCGATLTALRRTVSNGFREEQSATFESVEKAVLEGRVEKLVLPVEDSFLTYPPLVLTQPLAAHYLNGVQLWLNQLQLAEKNSWLRIYGPQKEFLGIGFADEEKRRLTSQTKFFQGDMK